MSSSYDRLAGRGRPRFYQLQGFYGGKADAKGQRELSMQNDGLCGGRGAEEGFSGDRAASSTRGKCRRPVILRNGQRDRLTEGLLLVADGPLLDVILKLPLAHARQRRTALKRASTRWRRPQAEAIARCSAAPISIGRTISLNSGRGRANPRDYRVTGGAPGPCRSNSHLKIIGDHRTL
jgi:hypothetical protein